MREIVTEHQDAFILHIGVIASGLAFGLKVGFCFAMAQQTKRTVAAT